MGPPIFSEVEGISSVGKGLGICTGLIANATSTHLFLESALAVTTSSYLGPTPATLTP